MGTKNTANGFTLIELTIVLILFGFVASSMILALKTYTEQQRIQKTNDAIALTTNAINAFTATNGRYPCPARITAAKTDEDYGYDVIYGRNPETAPTASTDTAGIQTNITNDLALVTSQVDLDGDTNNETILTGAVPYKTILDSNDVAGVFSIDEVLSDIEFAERHTADGWGNKIVYSVSRHLCDPTTPANLINDPRGVIDVITDQQCSHSTLGTVPVSLLPGEGECKQDNRRFAQFITFSQGENGRGAYNAETGQRVDICVNKVTIPVTIDPNETSDRNIFATGYPSDVLNCDYAEGIGDPANRGRFYAGLKSEGNNNTYFDDTLKFFFEDSFQIFVSGSGIPSDNGTPTDYTDDFVISQAINVNTGNIGIGTTTPQEQLHVEGDIQAFDILAEGYCDDTSPNSTRCLGAQEIDGQAGVDNNLICPTGQVAKRIQNGAFECEDPFTGMSFACGTNGSGVQLYLKEVFSDGRRTCCDTTDPINPVCTTI